MLRQVFLGSALAATLIAAAAQGGTMMAKPPPRQWELDTPLFFLSENKGDAYTLADSFQHNLVLGQTGSGKSSTTARRGPSQHGPRGLWRPPDLRQMHRL